MEKQIEEIVRDVDKAIRANFAWDVLNGGYVVSSADNIAQELYYAGYRKESDVAREIFAEIERLMLDGAIGGKYPAKVINPEKYAELKNKYTEDGE